MDILGEFVGSSLVLSALNRAQSAHKYLCYVKLLKVCMPTKRVFYFVAFYVVSVLRNVRRGVFHCRVVYFVHDYGLGGAFGYETLRVELSFQRIRYDTVEVKSTS